MIGKSSGAGVVPFSVGGVELAPGEMFRVSGSDWLAQFIRITRIEAGVIDYEALDAKGDEGDARTHSASLSEFPTHFVGAVLKYQAIVPDGQWEALAAFLKVVSRWQLDRGQVWQMYLWFRDMAIEREMAEMAELAQRKEAGE